MMDGEALHMEPNSMTKCYVWNCYNQAVTFIELTTEPYDRLPVCRKHEREFPENYPRVETDQEGKCLSAVSSAKKVQRDENSAYKK